MRICLCLFVSVLSLPALADSPLATLVHFKGQVRVFRNPMLAARPNEPAQVLFEDKYYVVESAKLGIKIKPKDIVSTGVDGKAKLVFPNGDTFMVGPGTAYALDEKSHENKKNASEQINLIYGKLRALISKSGPRKSLTIKTNTAIAGVRGTDLSVKQFGGLTEVTVIRGKVEVARSNEPDKKEIVAQGSTAKVEQMAEGSSNKPIEVKKATRLALDEIQYDSTIELKRDLSQLAQSEQKEIEDLEKKAAATVLKDIKEYSPEVYSQIKNKKSLDVTVLSSVSVATLSQTAPDGPKKPTLNELESGNADAYEKYFKPVQGK